MGMAIEVRVPKTLVLAKTEESQLFRGSGCVFLALCCVFLLFPWVSTTVSLSTLSWNLLLLQTSISWDKWYPQTCLHHPAELHSECLFWPYLQWHWQWKLVEGWKENERNTTERNCMVFFCPWSSSSVLDLTYLFTKNTVTCLSKK